MGMNANYRGAGLMVASMTAITVNDAFIKSASDELPLFQSVMLRGILTTIILIVLAYRAGVFRVPLQRRDRRLVAVRACVEVFATFLFLQALFNMPIANVSAIFQSLPLTITLAGALFLRETIGWRRWIAIIVGFCGVLIIVRPGSDGFNIYAVFALVAVLLITMGDLASRQLGTHVPSLRVALTVAASVTLFGILGSFTEEWVTVSPKAASQLAFAAVFIVIAYVCSVMAMRVGEVGFVSPFRYTSLLVALILGFVVFGNWPDFWTLFGSTIVVGTGIFTLHRERAVARAQGSERSGR